MLTKLNDKSYKTAEQVIQRLADVVSKNANLLLSIPQPGDGSIDEEEERIFDGMSAWIAINDQAICGSRPWRIYREGPTRLQGGMQNEQSAGAFTSRDVRFTTNKGVLYAALLAWPTGSVPIASLGRDRLKGAVIERVTLLAGGEVPHRREGDALHVDLPPRPANGFVPVLRLDGGGLI